MAKPGAGGKTIVRFRIAAVATVGMSPRPAMRTLVKLSAEAWPIPSNLPSTVLSPFRVSNKRDGSIER